MLNQNRTSAVAQNGVVVGRTILALYYSQQARAKELGARRGSDGKWFFDGKLPVELERLTEEARMARLQKVVESEHECDACKGAPNGICFECHSLSELMAD